VRELENLLERAMILAEGREIQEADLSFMDGIPIHGAEEDRSADPLDTLLSSVEARHIRHVLDATGWHLSRAATLLGIDRKTLWRKIKNYRLR
jgi:DNA-binding NtrC family response regulator